MPEQVGGRTFHRSGFDTFGEAASSFTGQGAIADGLADLPEHQAKRDPDDLLADMEELRTAAGLEEHA